VALDDSEIMGIEHKRYPLYGVQFHPESVMTEEGHKILENFLRTVKR
jgi:anthranilate synthase component 2